MLSHPVTLCWCCMVNSGADPCTGTPKRLAVVVSCADGAWGGAFLLVVFVCSLIYVGASARSDYP